MSPFPPTPSEEITDDLLYFARTDSIDDLKSALQEASAQLDATPQSILAAAVDSESGNTALHMAAANGHVGEQQFSATLVFNVSVQS